MSFSGYEYNNGGQGGGGYGFDPMGGGGFGGMDVGGGGGFEQGANPGSASKGSEKKGNNDRVGIVPYTIKQILESTQVDDGLQIDNHEVFSVSIMGNIDLCETHATNAIYKLNDGTGQIECKCYIEKDSGGVSKYGNCRENSFVHVIGNIRTYEGNKHVLIYGMTVVEDWNAVTHHLLETIMTHCQKTKGYRNNAAPAAPVGNSFASPSMNRSGGPQFNQQPSGGQALQKAQTGAQNQNDKILAVYRNVGENSSGPSLNDVLNSLNMTGTQISMSELRKAVDYMSNEGLLYTTIDENHYKPTEYY